MHVGAHGAEIDVFDRCRWNDLLFREYPAERVQQFLKLRGRRRDRGPPAPDPESAVMREGLVSPLVPMHVDPMHRPAGRVLPAAFRGYRLAAPGLQEARQPLLHGFRIPIVTDDPTGVVDADDQEPAAAVGKRTQRPAEAAQVSEPTLELGPRVLAVLDASLHVSPFHPCPPCRVPPPAARAASTQGVLPTQPFEASEVPIVRIHRAGMFHRIRGDVRVRRQVRPG